MAPADGRGPRLRPESSGWNFRLTALKGSETRVTDSTNVQALDHLHIHLGGVADEPQNCLVLPLGDMDP